MASTARKTTVFSTRYQSECSEEAPASGRWLAVERRFSTRYRSNALSSAEESIVQNGYQLFGTRYRSNALRAKTILLLTAIVHRFSITIESGML